MQEICGCDSNKSGSLNSNWSLLHVVEIMFPFYLKISVKKSLSDEDVHLCMCTLVCVYMCVHETVWVIIHLL